MRLFYEWGAKQVHKHGEEACSDNIAISRGPGSVTVALSACAVGKVACSTIVQFFSEGYARVVEFDCPHVILLRRRKVQPVSYDERTIDGKTARETVLDLQEGDWVVLVSGGAHPPGWGWEPAAGFLEKHARRELTAEELAGRVAEAACELYLGKPGDDVSIAVIKVRHMLAAAVLTGPPAGRDADGELIHRFLKRPGKLVVCGGTTAKIVARHLGRPLEVDLSTITADVPPIARLEGIDLVTEGILTLTRVRDSLREGAERRTVQCRSDGAAGLLRVLLEVDHTHFIVGQAVNPAHQNPDPPHRLGSRMAVVREIAAELRLRGKEVTFEVI